MLKKIPVTTAAEMMGCCPQFVRLAMQTGQLPIGLAVKMSSIWTYNIVPGQLAAYLQISLPDLEQAVNKIGERKHEKS